MDRAGAPDLAIWAWQARTLALARFTALYVGIALATYLVQFGGERVVDNAQFDLVIAIAIALGVAYDNLGTTSIAKRWGAGRVNAALAAVLIARLLANGRYESASILVSQDYRDRFHANAAIARREAETIAAIPGPVGCRNKVVCRAAGKPFVADDFKTRQLLSQRAFSEDAMEGMLRERGIAYVRDDPRTFSDALTRDIFARPQPSP